MSKEINILNYIYENENVTQRDIAVHVGMSLGGVNLLIKKMVSAGLIRIEAFKNPKLVQYILTPEGMREKATKTYRFIIRNYRQILRARQVIIAILKELENAKYKKVYLYGEKDEIFDIISMVVNEEFGDYGERYEYIGSIGRLKKLIDDELSSTTDCSLDEQLILGEKKCAITLIWNVDFNQRLESADIVYMNILERIHLSD